MAVSKRTRFEVLKRDNNTCRYCHAKDQPLTVDHVLPVALGGSDKPENLVAACRDCNAGKSSTSPDAKLVAGVSDDAIRWARAVEFAADLRADKRESRDQYLAEFEDAWGGWQAGGHPIPKPGGWRTSVRRFHDVGLPVAELVEAVESACGNDRVRASETFRYMCGIAWKMLTELQQEAQALYDVPATPAMPRGDLVADLIDRRQTPLLERIVDESFINAVRPRRVP